MRDDDGREDVLSETSTRAVADAVAQLQVDADEETDGRDPDHGLLAFLNPVEDGQHQDARVAGHLVLVVGQVGVRDGVDVSLGPHDAVGVLVRDDVRADEAETEEKGQIENELP